MILLYHVFALVLLRADAAASPAAVAGLDTPRPAVRRQPVGQPIWQLLWRQPTVRTGAYRTVRESFGQPALSVQQNRIIVATAEGDVVAYDTASGSELWRYAYGAPLESAATLVDSGGELNGQEHVVIGSRDGVLMALDVATGSHLWTADLDGEMRAAPRLAEGVLIVTTTANKVSAIEPDTGRIIWTHGRAAPTGLTVEGHARAAVAGGRVYAAFSDGFGAAFSLKDGELLWGRPLALQGGSFIDADADPCVLGDVVFMASYADGVYALNAADGQTLWNQPGEAISSLLLHNDQLIAASADGTVWGMVPDTGAVRWRTQLNAAPVSRLLGDDNTIAIAAGAAGLVVLDGRDGQPLQATPLGERVSNDMRKVGNLLTFMSAPGHLYLWQRRGASARHGAEGVLQR